ncbi:hypothetical protein N0V94_007955 [Neodidymelliopsis sp. IMI 364377]|nr:hypothetical protein N0V94_007955 [Neodidymelliopsis sp. IMI 364377]
MLPSIFLLAAVATATPFALSERDLVGGYPITQLLPVPGWNTTTDGFNSLAVLYNNTATQLITQANALAEKNIEIGGAGDLQYDYELKTSLASSLTTINNLLWQSAYQTERKICAIVTSINQQNVDTVKGNLRAGITAEVQAVVSISTNLRNTIAAIEAQATAFSNAEKAIITGLIQAIVTAAIASYEPAASLSAGLTAIGSASVTDVVQSLQSAVVALRTAATIDWTVT